MLLVDRRPLQQLVGDVRHQLDAPGPQHVGHAVLRVRIGRVALLEGLRGRQLRGVLVRDGQASDRAVGPQAVDRTPIGEARNDELRQTLRRGVRLSAEQR